MNTQADQERASIRDAARQEAFPASRYATTEEVRAAFEVILAEHDWTFRELAKGVGAPPSIEEEIEILERAITESTGADE